MYSSFAVVSPVRPDDDDGGPKVTSTNGSSEQLGGPRYVSTNPACELRRLPLPAGSWYSPMWLDMPVTVSVAVPAQVSVPVCLTVREYSWP